MLSVDGSSESVLPFVLTESPVVLELRPPTTISIAAAGSGSPTFINLSSEEVFFFMVQLY